MVFHVIIYYRVYYAAFLSPLVDDCYEEVFRGFPVYFYDRPSVKNEDNNGATYCINMTQIRPQTI